MLSVSQLLPMHRKSSVPVSIVHKSPQRSNDTLSSTILKKCERPQIPMHVYMPENNMRDMLFRCIPLPKDNQYYPAFWNDYGRIQYSTNCYAYALGIYTHPFTGGFFRSRDHYGFAIQPGEISGNPLKKCDVNEIISAVKADALRFGTLFIEASPNMKKPEGAWKVALFVHPGFDYHWYRQNPDGLWSHKIGQDAVSLLDARGRLIRNPEKACRDYRITAYGVKVVDMQPEQTFTDKPDPQDECIGACYSEFGGYFFVKPGPPRKPL